MANGSLAARADETVPPELRNPSEWNQEPSWRGPRHPVAELNDDDMWAVVEGDPSESDDGGRGDYDDDDWDWDDDDDDDDDDDWN